MPAAGLSIELRSKQLSETIGLFKIMSTTTDSGIINEDGFDKYVLVHCVTIISDEPEFTDFSNKFSAIDHLPDPSTPLPPTQDKTFSTTHPGDRTVKYAGAVKNICHTICYYVY